MLDIRRFQTILIINDEGIGNMVNMTPALRTLKMLNPSIHITVFGKPTGIDVVGGTPFVDHVITAPEPDAHYDVSFFAIWYNGYARTFKNQFLDQSENAYALDIVDGKSEPESYMEMARLFGYDGEPCAPFCAEIHAHADLEFGKFKVALADTCQSNGMWERKRWPHYKALAHLLSADDRLQIVLVGGRQEKPMFDFDEYPPGVLDTIGRYLLPETANILDRCDLVVSNDSGIARVAIAMETPTIMLYGATLVPKNIPPGKVADIMTADLECAPCQGSERWAGCKEWKCMTSISPEDVMKTIKGVMR